MKMKVYALRDAKMATYLPLICVPALGVLLRQLSDEINNKDATSLASTHPEDLELFEVGEWDNENGAITGATPKSVMQLIELKQK